MPSKWASFFSPQVPKNAFGLVSSTKAILLVTVAGRLHALTFGNGRHLLTPYCWEERYGFRVALNSVDPKGISTIDKQTLDSLGRQTRVQASRAAAVTEFGIDFEQDLLRAVVGKPTDDVLGVRMTGADALHAMVSVTLAGLPKLLKRYVDKSTENTYLKRYPWIAHIRAITDRALITALDGRLADKLGANDCDSLSLAVPEIIDWNAFESFRFDGAYDTAFHAELQLSDLVELFEEKGRVWAVSDLRTVHVGTVAPDGKGLDRWPLYKCLFGEVSHKNKTYVLSAGVWYQLAKSFADEVHADFLAVPHFAAAQLPFADKNEQAYCIRLGASDPRWCVMDRKPIYFGGAKTPIELCDLFSLQDKTFLHIKRYAGSAPLSHLFGQALVSGETFHLEQRFREQANQKLASGYKLPDCTTKPEGYTIVLGIVKDNPFDLPFFSKVTLRNAFKRLRGFGYDVKLAPIAIDPAHQVKKKAKKSAGAP